MKELSKEELERDYQLVQVIKELEERGFISDKARLVEGTWKVSFIKEFDPKKDTFLHTLYDRGSYGVIEATVYFEVDINSLKIDVTLEHFVNYFPILSDVKLNSWEDVVQILKAIKLVNIK